MQLLRMYQLAAGLCDSATGMMLVLAPATALRLMGLHPGAADSAAGNEVWLSYIGAFVLSVGLSYFLPLSGNALSGNLSGNLPGAWKMQWSISALTRSLVAIFLLWKFSAGALPGQWLEVAATDGFFALIQWIGLGRGWLHEAA
jgi:hypothetical protein